MRVRMAFLLALVAAVLGWPATAGAATTTRVSVDTTGADGDAASAIPSIDAKGRFVAFESLATDLVAGDGNGASDIFVRDLKTSTTTRISVDTTGSDSDGPSFNPSIDAKGRFVAFSSFATDLVPGDGNALSDIFVRDLKTGTTTRVSVGAGGDPDGASFNPSIDAKGRFVAFNSIATDLVAGDGNGAFDIFVRDLKTATTTRVSVDTTGGDSDFDSGAPSIDAKGRFVAFSSFATDLVPGDGNSLTDVFVRDLKTGTTSRVSVDTTGVDSDGFSGLPSIDGKGRFVAFHSFATDLVPGDGNAVADVFVRDLKTGTTTRASVDITGNDADETSSLPSMSANGRFVAFQSLATDLVAAGDTNGKFDIYMRDLKTATTTRVSVDSVGGDPDDASSLASIDGRGRFVAFDSLATDLVVGDGNAVRDVFVRDSK